STLFPYTTLFRSGLGTPKKHTGKNAGTKNCHHLFHNLFVKFWFVQPLLLIQPHFNITDSAKKHAVCRLTLVTLPLPSVFYEVSFGVNQQNRCVHRRPSDSWYEEDRYRIAA